MTNAIKVMRYYKVFRKEIIYQFVFVKANSKNHATEIAHSIEDGDCWRDSNYRANLLTPVKADPEEMKGKYIEEKEGSEIFYETPAVIDKKGNKIIKVFRPHDEIVLSVGMETKSGGKILSIKKDNSAVGNMVAEIGEKGKFMSISCVVI